MRCPGLSELTAWIHDEGESFGIDAHVAGCRDCTERADALRAEARVLTDEITRPQSLAALKQSLLQKASGRAPARSGNFWQVGVAAALILALTAMLLVPVTLPSGESVAVQDETDQALQRIEDLVARIAALEKEIARLEEQNRKLKEMINDPDWKPRDKYGKKKGKGRKK